MIYLDNAATTFPKPEIVYSTLDELNRNCCVNAGRGSYSLAKQATAIIDETKQRLAKLVKAKDASKVILGPSITIAFNQILGGINWKENDNLYLSIYDHNAVARTAKHLEKKYKINVEIIPVDKETLEIDIEALKEKFKEKYPKCVCVNHVSNVTGYVLPIKKVFEAAKSYEAITVLDTAQSLGLCDININELDIDFLAFAGHKTLYGPFGVGGFIYNTSMELGEYIVGGTGSDSLNLDMPKGIPNQYESSSPNVVAIGGLNASLQWRESVDDIYAKERELTQYLVSKLRTLEGVKLYLPYDEDKHIGIVSFNLEGYQSDELGLVLDEDFDIAVRTGYHCAPYVHEYLKNSDTHGTVRVSIGYFNEKKEIDCFIDAVKELLDEV